MENEEIRSTIEQIKAQVKAKPENKDKTDDEIDALILDALLKAYNDGKMEKDDLLGIAEAMGYEPTEEFLKDQTAPNPNPNAPAEGEGAQPPAENGEAPAPSAEDLEAVKTMQPGETPEEFKEKVEEVKEGGGAPASNPPAAEGGDEGGEGDEETEEDERKKASELWKMNLNK